MERGERLLLYTCDDRETEVRLTTAPGQSDIIVELNTVPREGKVPGVKFQYRCNFDLIEALCQWLRGPVRAAMVRDDVPEREQVQAPLILNGAAILICLSPNDVDNLLRHAAEMVGLARSLTTTGR